MKQPIDTCMCNIAEYNTCSRLMVIDALLELINCMWHFKGNREVSCAVNTQQNMPLVKSSHPLCFASGNSVSGISESSKQKSDLRQTASRVLHCRNSSVSLGLRLLLPAIYVKEINGRQECISQSFRSSFTVTIRLVFQRFH